MLPVIPNPFRKLLWMMLALAATLAGCGMEFPEPGPCRCDHPSPTHRQPGLLCRSICAEIRGAGPDTGRVARCGPGVFLHAGCGGGAAHRPSRCRGCDLAQTRSRCPFLWRGAADVPAVRKGRRSRNNVRWAQDIDEIQQVIGETARALGSPEQGLAVAGEMRTRLASLLSSGSADASGSSDANASDSNGASGDGNANTRAGRANVLYMTPTGVTSGPGSLIHEMLTAAGLENFQTRPGWWPIPLERLAYEQPDLLAVAFHESLADHPHVWSAIRHPVAQALLDRGNRYPDRGRVDGLRGLVPDGCRGIAGPGRRSGKRPGRARPTSLGALPQRDERIQADWTVPGLRGRSVRRLSLRLYTAWNRPGCRGAGGRRHTRRSTGRGPYPAAQGDDSVCGRRGSGRQRCGAAGTTPQPSRRAGRARCFRGLVAGGNRRVVLRLRGGQRVGHAGGRDRRRPRGDGADRARRAANRIDRNADPDRRGAVEFSPAPR